MIANITLGDNTIGDSTLLHVGQAKQYFVDDVLIESAQNLTRHVCKPERQLPGPVLQRDRDWEHVTYFTVSSWTAIWDPTDNWFKCWYEDWRFLRPPEGDERLHTDPGGGRGSRYLFARSRDGVHWEKPPLGIVMQNGEDTNIVLGDDSFGTVHSGYVLHDPDSPSGRFKMIYNRILPDADRYEIASSADGIHWRSWAYHPQIGSLGPNMGDVLTITKEPNTGIYWLNTRHPFMSRTAQNPGDPFLPRYPASPTGRSSFMRPVYPGDFSRENRRRVYRAQSTDFIHWSELHPLLAPNPRNDNIDEAFYGMTQMPFGDDWIGFLHVLQMTENTMHVELVYSRDGEHFQRVQPGKPWLRGTGRAGDWDRYMVNVYGPPVRRGDELFVYYGGSRNHHDWWIEGRRENLDVAEADDLGEVGYALGLIRMKADRFVSLRALQVREGILVTRPLAGAAGRLIINAVCGKGGYLKAELTDAEGNVLPGFSSDQCEVFMGDEVSHVVRWRDQQVIPDNEVFIKLRVYMRNADFFGFQFQLK